MAHPCLRQGWAIILHERPDLEKLLKPRGRTLIGKQGEDLLFLGDHGPHTNVISNIRGFHLVFHSNFAPLRLIF